MIADVVEDSAVKTGRRSEGVFFSAVSFVQKLVTGVGLLGASAVLALAKFPKSTAPADVPAEVIFHLGTYYAPTIIVTIMLMVACLLFYRIDRNIHEENLATLASAKET
ncbi:MAG: GPH family glycoside/pentoside/hexuronide:cation symporter [Arenicella sp.]|jgi:GPH family glycoside/pentoside/hexuronide:cation symporter